MKMLLHMCCAPCSVAIVQKLSSKPEIKLEGFFYNPNIHPQEEWNQRKAAVESMSKGLGLPVAYDDTMMQSYWKEYLGEDKNKRCLTCYALRLDKAARFASEKGFDSFTTSLLISPWQNHELIKELAEKAGSKNNVQFYYEDFRDLYREGREIARGRHWYMQKFCGCFYSYSESTHPKKPIYEI